jgi:cob(I)alamin adenosyltransferase
MPKKGLLIVHTGDGKGKTTAALGLACRMLGHGRRVAVIQFIKGSWKYGELDLQNRYADLLDFHVMGKGFTFKSKDRDADIQAAKEAWALAEQIIGEGRHALIVLDELTYLVNLKMIEEEKILDALIRKPPDVHIVITGRNASRALVEKADLVTEMKEIKHPLKAGIKAQKGIEF